MLAKRFGKFEALVTAPPSFCDMKMPAGKVWADEEELEIVETESLESLREGRQR